MTDSSGISQAQISYTPFGTYTRLNGSLDPDLQFCGYYAHTPSKLNIALFRSYTSSLGRWLDRDPIEEVEGTNLFSYVSNNPLIFADPLGLSEMGDAIANAAMDLATNHSGEFKNRPGRYTCAIFVNRTLSEAGAPPPNYPPGSNPGNVGDLSAGLSNSSDYSPVPTSNYTGQPGDIVIWSSHSGIVTSGGSDPNVTYGGSTQTGSTGTTSMSILTSSTAFAGKPKKIFRCCRKGGGGGR